MRAGTGPGRSRPPPLPPGRLPIGPGGIPAAPAAASRAAPFLPPRPRARAAVARAEGGRRAGASAARAGREGRRPEERPCQRCFGPAPQILPAGVGALPGESSPAGLEPRVPCDIAPCLAWWAEGTGSGAFPFS